MNLRLLIVAVAVLALIGGLVFFSNGGMPGGASLSLSTDEWRFKTACASHGNDREACACSWREADRRFEGPYMQLLIANISGDDERSIEIMSSGDINGFQFGVTAGQFSKISRQRCNAYF